MCGFHWDHSISGQFIFLSDLSVLSDSATVQMFSVLVLSEVVIFLGHHLFPGSIRIEMLHFKKSTPFAKPGSL